MLLQDVLDISYKGRAIGLARATGTAYHLWGWILVGVRDNLEAAACPKA